MLTFRCTVHKWKGVGGGGEGGGRRQFNDWKTILPSPTRMKLSNRKVIFISDLSMVVSSIWAFNEPSVQSIYSPYESTKWWRNKTHLKGQNVQFVFFYLFIYFPPSIQMIYFASILYTSDDTHSIYDSTWLSNWESILECSAIRGKAVNHPPFTI